MRDPVEQYEANAEAFYRETRIMAPGKDISAAMGGYDEDELRAKLWRVWLEKQHMTDRIRELEAHNALIQRAISTAAQRVVEQQASEPAERSEVYGQPEVYRG